jgi:hypothetical protein
MQKILNFFKTSRIVWEYKIIPIIDPEDGNFVEYELIMNALGDIGWELSAVYKDFLVFKKCSQTTKSIL